MFSSIQMLLYFVSCLVDANDLIADYFQCRCTSRKSMWTYVLWGLRMAVDFEKRLC